jgi:hypothetical protein
LLLEALCILKFDATKVLEGTVDLLSAASHR